MPKRSPKKPDISVKDTKVTPAGGPPPRTSRARTAKKVVPTPETIKADEEALPISKVRVS